uniref:Uncharacterized protein n=1 Tax=Kalanchoe fedtschenkoi TaxID=63787 RepID=A0A7N0V9E9_KALFE
MNVFFLLSLCLLVCVARAASPAPVLDVDGNKVRAGVKYYILPLVRGRGGGLTLGPRTNNTCPLNVLQEQNEVSNGLPLTFSPVDKKGIVRESTDMNIKFSAQSICADSTVWKLGSYDEATGKYFITAGGVEGNPGRSTTGNWFKIDKSGEYYKLVFCPGVCNFCKVICKDIGIHIEGGKRFLALTDTSPFLVFFKRA